MSEQEDEDVLAVFKNKKRCCATCKREWGCTRFSGITENMSALDESEFNRQHVCEDYVPFFIEYPITVKDIENPELRKEGRLYAKQIGKLVKIRPCAEEYNGKTYLGLFLGVLPIEPTARYNSETQVLKLELVDNPAIWVLELNKIIYGYESFWGIIDDPSEIKEITTDQIANLPYMRALKELTNRETVENANDT
jgi:hypothetical protein